MDIQLWQEMVLYRRRIHHYKEKHFTTIGSLTTLESVVELTTIIPEFLIGPVRMKLAPSISVHNNFEDVIHYLNWLDSLAVTIERKEFFTTVQFNALVEHRETTLEEFLTDEHSMLYYPYVILENIRSKIMKIQRMLTEVDKTSDLYHHYTRRLEGFMTMISQPAFAIGELAALKDE